MFRKSSGKVLVTGAAGFIGSEFVRQAVARGYSVVVVDKLTYAGDLARLKSVADDVAFYKVDIADGKKLEEVFKKEKPRAVVHFAAESHVDRSILDDTEFIKTNIVGTQALVNVARKAGVEKFVHLSTDEVYGEIERGKFKEAFPLKPRSPYSASKASADLLVQAAAHTFDFPAVIVRPSNNYGPWQYPEKFIPVIIYKALNYQPVPVYAQGLNVREWLHISDCAAAILKVLEQGKVGDIYNIGSGDERKNIDLVRIILKMLGRPETLISFVKDRLGHDWRYALDSRKIREDLAWSPKIGVEQGMARTVAWYCEHLPWVKGKVVALERYWKKVYRSA
ncbi:MAG: dTDP-glucose 4,6-dehydratase [Candidatus Omnitrophica bacterium]|nr:dTDP-glucose 4,6-dehydratase [Candidatus Omnitrophota bacterium]